MKKLLSFFICTSIVFSQTISTYAKDAPIKIAIDNVVLTPSQNPIIINGRTMVPVRFVSEELDYNVKWDGTNKNVYIHSDIVTPSTFTNPTNDIQVYLDNKLINFTDQKPVIVNNSTLIPLKAVAENMNVEVKWDNIQKQVNIYTNEDINNFSGYTVLEVDGGDLSGTRQPNVVVDIGFGDRNYYAFTNEYGQLVKVTADRIILQDDNTEPVLSSGRYYPDEAKVPGVESTSLDEGHVIADSLGGVSNAYNITPQNSTLNRSGDQAYMEKVIRDAGGATNFTAIITYPDTTTQIPSHYSYTYTLNGNVINDEFDNVNPDTVNIGLDKPIITYPTTSTSNNTNGSSTSANTGVSTTTPTTSQDVVITALNKKDEYVTIKNNSSVPVNLTNWKIVSVRGNQTFTFPSFTLNAGKEVKVGDTASNSNITFHWLDGKGTWNNTDSDPAELYDSNGALVSTYLD